MKIAENLFFYFLLFSCINLLFMQNKIHFCVSTKKKKRKLENLGFLFCRYRQKKRKEKKRF